MRTRYTYSARLHNEFAARAGRQDGNGTFAISKAEFIPYFDLLASRSLKVILRACDFFVARRLGLWVPQTPFLRVGILGSRGNQPQIAGTSPKSSS